MSPGWGSNQSPAEDGTRRCRYPRRDQVRWQLAWSSPPPSPPCGGCWSACYMLVHVVLLLSLHSCSWCSWLPTVPPGVRGTWTRSRGRSHPPPPPFSPSPAWLERWSLLGSCLSWTLGSEILLDSIYLLFWNQSTILASIIYFSPNLYCLAPIDSAGPVWVS